jgi:hypothetical protein
MGLNGWQRLFVVVSIIVLLPLIAWIGMQRPTAVSARLDVISVCNASLEAQAAVAAESGKPLSEVGGGRFGGIPVQEVAPVVPDDICHPTNLDRAIADQLASKREFWIESSALFLGVPIAGLLSLYGFGWSIGWVQRGFRAAKTS